ncbi:MAG: PAS sensor histidine kinase [Halonotius sp. J07HN4]|nr:MAG: PAS sensor histidine kinase [Halonotius sp. J07HN4]
MGIDESSKLVTKRVVYVGDDAAIDDLTPHFDHEGSRFTVETVAGDDTLPERIAEDSPECILFDDDSVGHPDTELLSQICDKQPAVPVIVLIGDGDAGRGGEAIHVGATDCVDKQLVTTQCDILINRIQTAVQSQESVSESGTQTAMMRLAESTGDTGGWEYDLETETVEITPGYSQLTGLSGENEISAEEVIELYHPADRPAVRAATEQAIQTGDQTGGIWRIQPDNGEQLTVDVTIEPVLSGGTVQRLHGSIRDVTERHKRREEHQQIETLFQHTQGPLFLIDVDDEFVIRRVNPAWEDETGVSPGQSHGKTVHQLFGEKQGNRIARRYRQCVEQQEPIEYEEQLRLGDEMTYWETRIAPVVIGGNVEYIAGSTRDITDKRERQRELRLLQQAIDNANIAITLSNPSQADNPIVYANDAYGELTGYTKSETLGENCRCLQGKNTDETQVAALREAIDNEEPITVELRNYRKDGTEFWNRLTVTPIYDDDGTLIRYLGTQQDVTDRKESRQELQAEREFIQQALDSLEDLFYVVDPDGTIKRWNQTVADVTGYTAAELDGMSITQLIPNTDEEAISEAIESTLQGDETTAEAELQTTDGETIPFEWSIARLTDTDGETIGLVGIGRDISQRREREQRFQALVEKSNDSISVIDSDGRFQYQSPSIEHILGYDHREVVGDAVWEYIHPDDHDAVQHWFESVLSNGSSTEPVEYRAQHADGSWQWMEASGYNQINSSAVSGCVINSHRITARKQREQHLSILDRVLRHNFRNDMNVIRGRAEAIRSTTPEMAAEHAIEIVDKSDELLEIAEKQRQLTSLIRDDSVTKKVDLEELLQYSVSTVTAEHPDATATVDCPADISIHTTTDIEKAIIELITNAIIHSDGDAPAVTVSAVHSAGLIHIDIADNCPPLPEVEKSILTDSLQETPLYHGSGLGLWLVRLIITQLGGTIYVDRHDAGGNTVRVELPE